MRWVIVIVMLICVPAVPAEVEVTVRKAEALFSQLPASDPWERSHDGSTLAWNESYTLHALVNLYEASGNRKYLDELVRRGDRMLTHRDDHANKADWSGHVHKRWGVGTKYTVAEGLLVDSDGKPSIKLRSILFAYNQLTKVEVTAGRGTFAIHLTNKYWKRDETFSDLSMDPASPRFFPRIINDFIPRKRPICDPGKATQASQLLKAQVVGFSAKMPKSQKLLLTPLWEAHVGYAGIIYHPLMRFALLVKSEPGLKDYQPAADRFVQAAQETFLEPEMQRHWRDGPGADEGYYINALRGGADMYDNVGHPFNYLGKLVCTEMALWQLTDNPMYRDQSERMMNLFKHRLKSGPADTYIWSYWYEPVTTGWTVADDVSDNTPNHVAWPEIEDVSHGALDIAMAMCGYRANIVFDRADMGRFANTFKSHVVRKDLDGFNAHVDGTGSEARYRKARVQGWLPLCVVDPKVYDIAMKVYQTRDQDDLVDLAALLKWKKAMGEAGPPPP